jgi:fructosamine-3-kinase
MSPEFISLIGKLISEKTGTVFKITNYSQVSGGCIHYAFVIEGNNQRYFLKINSAHALPMFIAEAAGLHAITNSDSLHAPQPLLYGNDQQQAWLVMEYLPLTPMARGGLAALGEQLATLHKVSGHFFGWAHDNYIGSSEQKNMRAPNWPNFWHDQRLGFQLMLAAKNGYGGKLQNLGERLLNDIDLFFQGYSPQPSLLHGDLWNGNVGFLNGTRPVIFDPAVYYGDREADVAMTELFGGFDKEFYTAYEKHFPLDQGYKLRKSFYNLYHLLNHLNLFGGGYLNQALGTIEHLLAEIH